MFRYIIMAKTTAPKTTASAKESTAKQTKTTAPKKSTKTTAPKTPVVEPAVIETAPKEVENAVVSETPDIEHQLTEQSLEFVAKLHQISSMITSLKTEYRALEKKWTRELKQIQKLNSKKKRKVGNRAPSGFVKPTKISEQLSTFLNKPSGIEMARTEVTREINKYIRSNNLQDKTNGRKIIPDAKLSALLNLKKTDELTYFNLQKFMSPHFEKASDKVNATSA